ncbi:hypothetical protein ACFXOK_16720 [Streptomyces sp. NPDC059173]|uniref:hypothetical protein n=1 Tax=Streptomyces sp. NPDC059173 TaxID=3346756 RepID=UPI0036B9FE5B
MHLTPERLALSSRKWMDAAFAAFSDGPSSEGMAVHHAAVATEHLLKAFLARIHPSLVVEGKDFLSLLYAAGHGELRQVKGPQVKTIQLGEAYERARVLLPGIPPRPRGPWPLADARNGVAHAGYHDRDEVIGVFVSCIKVIDPLLVELGIGADYWGPHEAMHDKLLQEEGEAARIRLEQKLARSRRIFAERYAHIGDGLRDVVLTTVASLITPSFTNDYSVRAVCPACSSEGSSDGLVYVDRERWVVSMTPIFFDCAACDLHLEVPELSLVSSLADDMDLDMRPEEHYSRMGGGDDLDAGQREWP